MDLNLILIINLIIIIWIILICACSKDKFVIKNKKNIVNQKTQFIPYMTNSERIKYYTNNVLENNYEINQNNYKKVNKIVGSRNDFNHLLLNEESDSYPVLYSPENETIFLKFLRNIKNIKTYKKCLIIIGDKNIHNLNYPIFAKVRNLNYFNKYSILHPLYNRDRHWKEVFNLNDTLKWEEKYDNVIWRGVSTGNKNSDYNTRIKFCNLYFHKYNVGITKFVQDIEPDYSILKNNVNITTMLKYKYIISLEGNDKDSGLNWKLYSNSLVIMPKPTWESWLMEGKLVPWFHYVPLNDDVDNLEEILEWCKMNQDKCKEIVRNSTEYMRMFLDEENENEIIDKLFDKYSESVEFF